MTFEAMLDTNIVSELMRDPDGRVASRLQAFGPERTCISVVVACELRYGARKAGSSRIEARIEAVLAAITVLPFDLPADHAYAEIRDTLARQGRPIGPTDLFIAAHALSLGLVLVTANTREFERVPGLKVENWARAES